MRKNYKTTKHPNKINILQKNMQKNQNFKIELKKKVDLLI